MHLLVLSAFRPESLESALSSLELSQCTFWCSVLSDLSMFSLGISTLKSLNAPSGAQCFPTRTDATDQSIGFRLNAPSGAQCFPTCGQAMLLASSFRCLNAPSGAQCFPTPLNYTDKVTILEMSQCTFWCSVLSDSAPRKPRHTAVYRNEIAADLESTTSNRPAPVQLNHTTAKYRHKPPQRRRRPLPTSTPPASNEPKPKNRRLTTTPESTSSYWASRILCCKVMPILPAE